MSTSEKFCLKWNDFQENISSTFGSLREDINFADVTLACEDGKQVKAHKVILAASSPFFQNLFIRNTHAHPMIYMRGIKHEDLVAIADFLYYGEANIYQENLDNFLKIAEELKLKGLTVESSGAETDSKIPGNETNQMKTNNSIDDTNLMPLVSTPKLDHDNSDLKSTVYEFKSEGSVVLQNGPLFVGLKELEEEVKSIMVLKKRDGHNIYVCNICGKEATPKNSTLMKNHIEANHIYGISIPCNFCGKTFRSRKAISKHRYRHHQTTNAALNNTIQFSGPGTV